MREEIFELRSNVPPAPIARTAAGSVVPSTPDQAWPAKSGREMPDYQFNGYRVTKDERPTFLYTIHGVKIEDFPNAVASPMTPSIRRTITLSAMDPVEKLYFRAAVAGKIVPLDNG